MHIHLAGLTREEKKLFRRLNTQVKIQDYLETIPANFETGGQTLHSPRSVLKYNTAHCFEGALLACAILLSQGHKAVILDLQPDIKSNDDGHALALFKVNGLFGALSKTNHPSIRYRDPIYKSIRELVMSYFHEYFLSDGAKNLRSYTILNLSKIKKNWICLLYTSPSPRD